MKTLTDDEKTALLKNVDALDALDEKLDKLYDELYDKDEDVLYNDCKDGSCGFPETDAASTTYFLSNAMKIVSLKTAENK